MYGVWSNIKNEFQFPQMNNEAKNKVWYQLIRKVGKLNIRKYGLEVKELIEEPEELKPSTVLSFGKYTGKRVSLIIEEDPKYIEWLLRETNKKIHKDVEEILKIKMKEVSKNRKRKDVRDMELGTKRISISKL